jgi:hypothetical protein
VETKRIPGAFHDLFPLVRDQACNAPNAVRKRT